MLKSAFFHVLLFISTFFKCQADICIYILAFMSAHHRCTGSKKNNAFMHSTNMRTVISLALLLWPKKPETKGLKSYHLFVFFDSRSIQKRLIFRWLANKIFLDPNRIKQLKNNMQLFIPHLDFWKSRSVSNLIKNSVPVHLIFFFSLSPDFFQVYGTNLKKNPVDKLKKIQICRTWNFSKVWKRP